MNYTGTVRHDKLSAASGPVDVVVPGVGGMLDREPAPAVMRHGTTTLYFAPKQPKGVSRGNWIQTDPEKGFFTILRLYSPLEPFFDKSWRPGEIEPVALAR